MQEIHRIVRSNLKFRHLHLLIALDEFRHLGRAADVLSLTQPALSKSLAEIEHMLGLQLFVRSPRGTEPTAMGAVVVRFARSVMADLRRTHEEVAVLTTGGAGRVNVGAMVVATPVLLAQAVQQLKTVSPHTSILIEEGDLTRLLPRLRVGEIDFILGRLEPGYSAPDLETQALYDEPMCLVVAPSHALANGKPVRWADLAQQAWVLPPMWANSRAKLTQEFYRLGLEPPQNVVETTSYLNTVTFMRELSAVAFVARSVGHSLADQGLGTVLDVPVKLDMPPIGLILLRNRLRSPSSLALMDCVRVQALAFKGPTKRRARTPTEPRGRAQGKTARKR